MSGRDSTQSLLVLRKLTRAIADSVRTQMTEYLATLAPLLRPKMVFGDYVEDGSKESTRRSDKAYKELQALWQQRPFSSDRELTAPVDVGGASLEITPFDYPYRASHDGQVKALTMRSPLRWVISYAGFSPVRLLELAGQKGRSSDELQRFMMHYLVLHVVVSNQSGLGKMFNALHFPLGTAYFDELPGLPITQIGCAVSTRRPPDSVIVQSAELTGMDGFEEVVVVEDILALTDPLRARMVEAVQTVDPALLHS